LSYKESIDVSVRPQIGTSQRQKSLLATLMVKIEHSVRCACVSVCIWRI